MHGADLWAARAAIPPFDPAYVSRSRAIERLRDSSMGVIAVTAPAGYGKTSYLAEWVALEHRVTASIALTPDDDDPVALLDALVAATAGVAATASVEARAGSASVADRLGRAVRLARGLLSAGQPFCILIDDVHLLGDECLDLLGIVVNGVPDGSQIVLASRDPLDGLIRGEAASSAAAIRSDDLRIDASGAARIAEQAGASVDAGVLADWVDHCGGWAAGLHMCALLSEEEPLEGIAARTLVSDYLYEECVRRLPEDVRRFLVTTSVLPMLIPDLCDAVAGRTDSADVLEYLSAHQLFVTADAAGASFQLHALFREYLLGEARRVSPIAYSEAHLRAADWWERRGGLPEAIEHRISGADLDGAAALVAVAGIAAYESGQVATLERWLDAIGERHIVANPATMVVIAWFSILAGTEEAAERWGALLESLPEDGDPVSGLSLEAARAMVRAILLKAGMERALGDAALAASLGAADSRWRDPALQILGSTLLHAGREAEAIPILGEARRLAVAHGNPATVVMCDAELALLALEDGEWGRAAEYTASALGALAEGGIEGYVMSAYVHAAAACVAMHSGDEAEGSGMLARAMSERVRCTRSVPLIAIPVRLLLARAQLRIGDLDAARMLLSEVDRMLPPGDCDAVQRRVAALRGDADGREGSRPARTAALTVAEQRLLPYLQTYLTRAEIAERLFVSRNTVSSQIRSIFGKLGVSDRATAVRRAEEQGLLGSEQPRVPPQTVSP